MATQNQEEARHAAYSKHRDLVTEIARDWTRDILRHPRDIDQASVNMRYIAQLRGVGITDPESVSLMHSNAYKMANDLRQRYAAPHLAPELVLDRRNMIGVSELTIHKIEVGMYNRGVTAHNGAGKDQRPYALEKPLVAPARIEKQGLFHAAFGEMPVSPVFHKQREQVQQINNGIGMGA